MSNGLQDWDDMDEREWQEMERTMDEEAQRASDQAAFHHDQEMRLLECEEAIREALTRGVSLKKIRVLCSECGISYERVVGE